MLVKYNLAHVPVAGLTREDVRKKNKNTHKLLSLNKRSNPANTEITLESNFTQICKRTSAAVQPGGEL